MKRIPALLILCLFSGLLPDRAGAGFQFSDPGIPHGEVLTYRCLKKGVVTTITDTCEIKMIDGRQVYEIVSLAPNLDMRLRLEKPSMAIVSVDSLRKYKNATTDTNFQLLSEAPNTNDDEIKVAHFGALPYLYRGFPFQNMKKLTISYYSDEEKKQFSMSVSCDKREKITIDGTGYECYKLVFGLDGFWGTFLPKRKYWYSVDPPHFLVRYEGAMGMPGSPKSVIELVKRSVPGN